MGDGNLWVLSRVGERRRAVETQELVLVGEVVVILAEVVIVADVFVIVVVVATAVNVVVAIVPPSITRRLTQQWKFREHVILLDEIRRRCKWHMHVG